MGKPQAHCHAYNTQGAQQVGGLTGGAEQAGGRKDCLPSDL